MVSGENKRERENLGGLHRPQLRTIKRCVYESLVYLFDSIFDRQTANSCQIYLRPLQARLQYIGRHQWTGTIMNHYPTTAWINLCQSIESYAHRILSAFATGHNAGNLTP